MLGRIVAAASVALAITAGTVLGSGSSVSAGSASGDEGGRGPTNRPIRLDQHDLYIEYNASAGDAGLQLGVDAESWSRFTLHDTDGNVLIRVDARGRLHSPFGLSELFLEASEPSLAEVPFNLFKRTVP